MGLFDWLTRRPGRGRNTGEGYGAHAPIPAEILSRVKLLEVRARRLVDTRFSGEYASIFKGRGIEFSEVREYQVGDDVRTIDWNVTARRGRPYVKRFVEERELNVLLLVDLSASKAFGTGSRSNHRVAVEIAAIVALSAIRNNDRVGLFLMTDRMERVVPPASGRRHALRILRELLTVEPEGRGTDLSVGLEYVARAFPHRGIVFLISDFILPEPVSPRLRKLMLRVGRQHDLIPVRLTDTGAEELPDTGWVRIVDPETGARGVVNGTRRAGRKAFAGRVREDRAQMSALFAEAKVDVVEIAAHEDHVQPLVAHFRRRERSMK